MKLNIHYQDKILKDQQFGIENELINNPNANSSLTVSQLSFSSSGSNGSGSSLQQGNNNNLNNLNNLNTIQSIIDKCTGLLSLTTQLPNQYQIYLLNGIQIEQISQIDATVHDIVVKANPNLNIDPILNNLNDNTLKKKALFDLKDILREEVLVRKFVEKNGIQLICNQLPDLSGNTLSYALNAIHSVMQFEFSSHSIPIELVKYLLNLLDPNTNPSITKTTLSLLVLFMNFRSRGYVEIQSEISTLQSNSDRTKGTINSILVGLLGSGTVDVQLNALTLVNSMLIKSTNQMGAAEFQKLVAEFDSHDINSKLKKLVESAISGEFKKQLFIYQRQRLQTIKLRKAVSYSKESPEHEAILMKLWNAVYPNVKLESRVSEQWKQIGFQGTDPCTDFRATGLFGLENLVYFAENHTEKFKKILQNNVDRKEREYPTCTAGINITQMLTNDIFKVADEKLPDSPIFPILFSHAYAYEEVYCITFQILDTTWDEMMGSYMNWPKIFSSVKNQILTTLESKPSTLEAFHWAAYLKNSNNSNTINGTNGLEDDHDQNDDVKKLKLVVKKEILEMIKLQKVQLLADGFYFKLQKPIKNKNSLSTILFIKLNTNQSLSMVMKDQVSKDKDNKDNNNNSSKEKEIKDNLSTGSSINLNSNSNSSNLNLNSKDQSILSLSSSIDQTLLAQELNYSFLSDGEKPSNFISIKPSELTFITDSNKKKENKSNTNLIFTINLPKEEKPQIDLISNNKEDISNFIDSVRCVTGKTSDLSIETVEEYKTLVNLSMKLKLLDLEGVDLPKDIPSIPPPPINYDFCLKKK